MGSVAVCCSQNDKLLMKFILFLYQCFLKTKIAFGMPTGKVIVIKSYVLCPINNFVVAKIFILIANASSECLIIDHDLVGTKIIIVNSYDCRKRTLNWTFHSIIAEFWEQFELKPIKLTNARDICSRCIQLEI